MAFFSGIGKLLAGGVAIVGGVFLGAINPALSGLVISAGAGLALDGLGTLISGPGTGRQGNATPTRNPIKPWDVIVGQTRIGGTCVYQNQWPPPGYYGAANGPFSIFGIGPRNSTQPNIFLDLVFVLDAHRIQSIDGVLFEGYPVPLDPTAANYAGGGPGKLTPTLGATSYNPTQTNKRVDPGSFVRFNGIVTVTCPFDIPALQVGDPIIHQDEDGGMNLTDTYLAGTFVVQEILNRVPGTSITYTVLCGGPNVTVTNNGWVTTAWPSYGRNVYVEYMLGDQVLGQSFEGLISGTPFQGTGVTVNPNLATNTTPVGGTNPWTNSCSLQGKAAVFIRLYYQSQYFSAGLPQISFLVHGKPDIYDPRLGACTGIGTATLYTAGSGGYLANDILTVSGGTGGEDYDNRRR